MPSNTYKEIQNIDRTYAPAMAERANVYLLQSKVQWAEVFFQRALKADPKCGRAEFGLAHLAKLRKDEAGYLSGPSAEGLEFDSDRYGDP